MHLYSADLSHTTNDILLCLTISIIIVIKIKVNISNIKD